MNHMACVWGAMMWLLDNIVTTDKEKGGRPRWVSCCV